MVFINKSLMLQRDYPQLNVSGICRIDCYSYSLSINIARNQARRWRERETKRYIKENVSKRREADEGRGANFCFLR